MVPAPFADSPVLWAYNGFAGVLSSDISLTALALPRTIFGGLVAFGNAHIKSSLLAHEVHQKLCVLNNRSLSFVACRCSH